MAFATVLIHFSHSALEVNSACVIVIYFAVTIVSSLTGYRLVSTGFRWLHAVTVLRDTGRKDYGILHWQQTLSEKEYDVLLS